MTGYIRPRIAMRHKAAAQRADRCRDDERRQAAYAASRAHRRSPWHDEASEKYRTMRVKIVGLTMHYRR